jgi:hypothetical protein
MAGKGPVPEDRGDFAREIPDASDDGSWFEGHVADLYVLDDKVCMYWHEPVPDAIANAVLARSSDIVAVRDAVLDRPSETFARLPPSGAERSFLVNWACRIACAREAAAYDALLAQLVGEGARLTSLHLPDLLLTGRFELAAQCSLVDVFNDGLSLALINALEAVDLGRLLRHVATVKCLVAHAAKWPQIFLLLEGKGAEAFLSSIYERGGAAHAASGLLIDPSNHISLSAARALARSSLANSASLETARRAALDANDHLLFQALSAPPTTRKRPQ